MCALYFGYIGQRQREFVKNINQVVNCVRSSFNLWLIKSFVEYLHNHSHVPVCSYMH